MKGPYSKYISSGVDVTTDEKDTGAVYEKCKI
jgi:hypothetical protein